MFLARKLQHAYLNTWPTANIVGRYDGADLSGAIVADSSGQGNDISAIDSPTQTSMNFGTGVDLTPPDRLHATSIGSGASAGVTIAAFVRPDVSAGSSESYAMALETSNGVNSKLFWIIGHPSAAYRNQAYILSDEGTERKFSVSALTVSTEYHLALTFDLTTLRAYIDGSEVGNIAFSGTWAGGSFLNYAFGAKAYQGASPAQLDCAVQKGYVYDAALSASDIALLATGV